MIFVCAHPFIHSLAYDISRSHIVKHAPFLVLGPDQHRKKNEKIPFRFVRRATEIFDGKLAEHRSDSSTQMFASRWPRIDVSPTGSSRMKWKKKNSSKTTTAHCLFFSL